MQITDKGSGTVAVHHLKHISVEVPEDIDKSYVQEAISAVLYNQGKLPLKEARQLIGSSRREFEEIILPKYGFSIMDHVDIDDEINQVMND